MSARQALINSATVDFKTYVTGLLADRGLNMNRLSLAIYGRDEKGGVRNTGTTSNIINGKTRLTEKMAVKWSKVLKVPSNDLLAANLPLTELSFVKKKKTKQKSVMTEALIHSNKEPQQQNQIDLKKISKVSPSTEVTVEERLSLVVNSDGTATLRLNLVKVSLDTALRLVQSVELNDMVRSSVPLSLTYDKPS